MKDYKDFQTQRAILIEYMQVMIALEVWHGVADVAMDIRELEARNSTSSSDSYRFQG
jgi:hypothetical protein